MAGQARARQSLSMQLSSKLSAPAGGLRSLVRELAPDAQRGGRSRRWLTPVLALAAAGVFAVLIDTHGTEVVRALNRALDANWHLVVLAAVLEVASIGGYVLLLHRVVSRSDSQLRLKDSYDITLGSSAATRLVPTAGLGGVAVTVWALRARGVRAGELTERLLAFLLLLYGVYMVALAGAGIMVASGLVHVSTGAGLGLLGVALAGAAAAAILLLLTAPSTIAAVLARIGGRSGRASSAGTRLSVLLASLRRAGGELRRPHPALLGAVAWWGFDIGVLVTMLHAFGVRLPLAAVVLAYFLGSMFNLLPLPGSLSGGLAGCLIALGCPVGGAIAAVLAYRTLAVWLPAAPGIAALASLRRSVAGWRAAGVVVTAPSHTRSPYRSRVTRRREFRHEFPRLQGAGNVAS
jgi:uncharacterized membrane protein YbhN (UPF0104 family)